MIKAKQVSRNLNDNNWHFETGEVSAFNKFGEGKKRSFDKLDVVATPFSSNNKK
jgi:hypothetical protein